MLYKYFYENARKQKIDLSVNSEITALKVNGINGHSIDIKTSQGLGQIGETITETTVKGKNITIDGVIRGNVPFNRKQLIDIIRPREKGLLYAEDIKTGDIYTIDCIAKDTPFIGFGNEYQNFQFKLFIPFPYWKREKTKAVDIRKLKNLFRFPRDFSGTWKFSEYERSEFINVQNDGNDATGLKIILRASQPVKNPKILNVETNEFLKLNYTMNIGETIIITTGYSNKKITSNIHGNIFKNIDLLNSTFLQLNVGANIFKFTADENQEHCEVVVQFEEVLTSI